MVTTITIIFGALALGLGHRLGNRASGPETGKRELAEFSRLTDLFVVDYLPQLGVDRCRSELAAPQRLSYGQGLAIGGAPLSRFR